MHGKKKVLKVSLLTNASFVWKKRKCPAYGQVCSSCGKPNHFAVKCREKSSESKRSSQPSRRGKVHQLADSDDPSYSSEEILSENAVNTVEIPEYKSKIFAHVEIEGVLLKMQVDSGASCNVSPRKFLTKETVITKLM